MLYERKFHIRLLVSALLLAETVQAEEAFKLGRIEVTVEHELPGLGTARVEAEVLREENRETVAEALDRLPGVTLNNFGPRNEQGVYVRGFDRRQVPVFIDGIPIYVPYDGYVDLGRFTTYDLAEIDIDKSFSSVLYGSNTLGGAINLISRRPRRVLEGEVGSGYSRGEISGSDSARGWFNIGTNQGRWYAQFSGSYLKQDSFALSDDYTATRYEEGGLRDNAYRKDTKVNLKLGYTPSPEDEYALGYVNQQGEKGTPPYAGDDSSVTTRFWQWPYWNKESLYAITQTGLGDGATLKSRLYYDIFENSLYSYDDETYTTQTRRYAFQSWYDDYTYGASLEYGKPLGEHTLKLALNYKFDHHEEHDNVEPVRTFEDRSYSLALEDTYRVDSRQSLVAGISYDVRDSVRAEGYENGEIFDFEDNDTDAWNPQIGYFMELDSANQGRVTLSRKTRLPTIKDRYSYRFGTALPNPDLEAEKSTTLEFGWVHRFGHWARLDSAVFYSDIRDLIESVDINSAVYQLQNVGKVSSKGAEVGLEVWLGNSWEIGGNYSYLKQTNRSSDLKLTNVPEHKAQAWLTWHVTDPFSLSANAHYESERYTSTDGLREADSFTVFGLRAGYEFAQGWVGRLGVSNLTDENYAYQEGYPEAGRTWYGNLSYRF